MAPLGMVTSPTVHDLVHTRFVLGKVMLKYKEQCKFHHHLSLLTVEMVGRLGMTPVVPTQCKVCYVQQCTDQPVTRYNTM